MYKPWWIMNQMKSRPLTAQEKAEGEYPIEPIKLDGPISQTHEPGGNVSIIKRTKQTESNEPDKKLITTTHYPTAITNQGIVTGWTPDPAQACPADAEMLDKVKKNHKGKFELVKGDGRKVDESPSAASEDNLKALREENARLRSQSVRDNAMLKDGEKAVRYMETKIAELLRENKRVDQELRDVKNENEQLKKAQVKEPIVPAPAG